MDGWIWAENRGGEGAMRLQFTDTERHDPPDSTLILSQYAHHPSSDWLI